MYPYAIYIEREREQHSQCSSILVQRIPWSSLAGYSPQCLKESDTTEVTQNTHTQTHTHIHMALCLSQNAQNVTEQRGNLHGCKILKYSTKKLEDASTEYGIPRWCSGEELTHQPKTQETQVGSLGWEELLEKEMATDSSVLAWKVPWTDRGDWCAAVHGVTKSRTQLRN